MGRQRTSDSEQTRSAGSTWAKLIAGSVVWSGVVVAHPQNVVTISRVFKLDPGGAISRREDASSNLVPGNFFFIISISFSFLSSCLCQRSQHLGRNSTPSPSHCHSFYPPYYCLFLFVATGIFVFSSGATGMNSNPLCRSLQHQACQLTPANGFLSPSPRYSTVCCYYTSTQGRKQMSH